ncbi:hypothetical protein Pse7367_3052 [Thalassoporum mexicanum PCC 7367]|uniref:hypothetical protein n=1 Tax=Thalassoporum mexicanum TaxID=3457544 RepID=UPI00029F8A82|nr:hypothetical protein [Pseudanabaena sp. PCC 7367]AFY71301.1 hypothetical protein Pse7367_3052 [Pseudanabaena sp. PCC 7367]
MQSRSYFSKERIYNAQELNPYEVMYLNRFQQLQNTFGDSCQIYVTLQDGLPSSQGIGAKIAKLDSNGVVTNAVIIKFAGFDLLGQEILEKIQNHLASDATNELVLEC